MKNILFLFLVFPIFAAAQTQVDGYLGLCPVKNGRINYTGVDSVSGVSNTELYNRAKAYISTVFPNFKDVVKLDDREMGKLTVKGIFQPPLKEGKLIQAYYEFYATTHIEVKDGRYRYEITDIDRTDVQGGYEWLMSSKKRADKISAKIDPTIRTYLAGLQAAMHNSEAKW